MIQSILLLEDDDDDREIFAEALKALSVKVHFISVSNGVEALNYLNTALIKPDLIFSDINMPIMNGFEFIKEMEANESNKAIPIVLLSTFAAYGSTNNKDFGHIPFYKKPSNFKMLCAIIAEIFMQFDLSESEKKNEFRI